MEESTLLFMTWLKLFLSTLFTKSQQTHFSDNKFLPDDDSMMLFSPCFIYDLKRTNESKINKPSTCA